MIVKVFTTHDSDRKIIGDLRLGTGMLKLVLGRCWRSLCLCDLLAMFYTILQEFFFSIFMHGWLIYFYGVVLMMLDAANTNQCLGGRWQAADAL